MKKANIKLFDYTLYFLMKSNLLLLSGDSGVGKTLLYKFFYNTSLTDSAIICIDRSILQLLKNKWGKSEEETFFNLLNVKNKLIVIDNADSLLTLKLRGYIGFDLDNNYLIFGRNVTGLFINKDRTAYLRRDDKKKVLTFDYKYEHLLK